MTRFVLAVALLGAAGSLGAQVSAPNISAPKRAAMNAAAATNAHTNAMTSPGATGAAGAPIVETRQRQTPATSPAPRTGATATAAPAAKPAGADSGGTVAVGSRGARGQVTFTREAFAYEADARRDPFFSLLRSNDLRPAINDLRLVTIIYDPTGRNSVAILRDLTTKDQYRVRVGQTLGRMRVSAIQPKQVTFVIEEFGFSRQETLALNEDTTARTK